MGTSRDRQPGRVTLMHVARAAGVSRTAASSALTQTGRVSAETAERVRRVARELNYRPNVTAQNLRRARSGAIGLVLPDDVTGLSYYMDFTFGIVDVANESGLSLVMLPHDASTRAVSYNVDGFIVIDAQDGDEHLRQLFSLGLPIVSGERVDAGLGIPTGIVESDHVGAMVELLDHLKTNGSRHPAFLGPGDDTAWGRALRAGYDTWCRANGVRPRLSDVPFSPAAAEAATACRRVLQQNPDTDALVCGSDHTAAVAVDVATTLGRTIGVDLLLASCVDSAVVQLSTPPITALDLDPREFGAHCARLFVRLLAEEEPPASTVIETSPTRLRIRASTAGAPPTGK
ncbi:hypothetical protein LK09_02510 [Microbacterium mangrovi]|uniref:HTH lacI-type domain-containing protein n=1 Tax=Microbacterium mangrovi TaxID=1348253 RepID=A0A0B2AD60_9MICO|nr:LacI family DNA-binding transcriptional regulator [Microbacterium mangrovi]KHK99522.1 hypothetical protein LK09_02510 [Microbacterium mangrovi]